MNTYITPKTFWTTQTKRNLRNLILSQKVNYIFDTANPFEAAMVDTCITSFSKTISRGNSLKFLDGSKDLKNPIEYSIGQNTYLETQNSVIFKPTDYNLKINNLYGRKVKDLYDKWWDKISTSKNISKNEKELQVYRENLKPGDLTLLGLVTEGGVGLQTGNNGKYIAVRKSTKWANNILESRPKKLAEAIKTKKIKIDNLEKFSSVDEFLNTLSETDIAELFDNLKENHGRDIFGQGYIYRIVDDADIADVEQLTADEKLNGIDKNKNFYVPYDKGDKDGNRWYLETPFAIAWTKENVGFLKTDPKARYQGFQYYFREGFCWSLINGTRSENDLKFRISHKGVNDVGGMSLSSLHNLVPEFFIVCLGNSSFISRYTEAFVNFTVNFQVNDARLIPIIIPSNNEVQEFLELFSSAYKIKKEIFSEDSFEIGNSLTEIENCLNEKINDLYHIK